jgi:hypothetical protein
MHPDPERIDSIFLAAAERATAAERAAYLDVACAQDPALREHVERLLAAPPALTRASSWMLDRSWLRRLACALRAIRPTLATLLTVFSRMLASHSLTSLCGKRNQKHCLGLA